jgi:uncharacterized protein (TIGR02757 family)
MKKNDLRDFLNRKVDQYDQPFFIHNDPVCIPHLFTKKQDIEIAGLFAALFAWGNRTTIINKSKKLMQLMNMQPHEFVLHHSNKDLKKLAVFKHRTFNADDLYYFIAFLHHHYTEHDSLEKAFAGNNIEEALIHFKHNFFSLEHLRRTEKHISSPEQGSTCKRLNMYLRWMVRNDNKGVDFGIWKTLKPSQLICPIDVHVARVAKRFGLLRRKQIDWQAALELTEELRKLDAKDPVKYDFALFGLGVVEKY